MSSDSDKQLSDAENKLLQTVFAEPGEMDTGKDTVPLLPVPAALSERLRAIGSDTANAHSTAPWHQWFADKLFSWGGFGVVAASLAVVAVAAQLYLQQQTISQLEQAQRDLTVALQYLHQTNQTVEASLRNTLGEDVQRAVITPMVENVGGRRLVPDTPKNEIEL